ncbi:receptor-like cytosolic serine/threonine-protein kinase RBK1 isoform X2 [Ipomoea triloba]|uniref:receptor-like cytosolic serine/threonine-protein kinase RBK1 isoform X2 n=1 Tax=Ipomoea triloba TaxID=35885 RepID=UPI00125E97FC|nr:receptor-like cytosolic serine/threonine-protein kinase RBK1 isoform X2 [Ipomoea triloba]
MDVGIQGDGGREEKQRREENPTRVSDILEEDEERNPRGDSSPRGVLEIPTSGSSDSDNNSSINGERSRSFGSPSPSLPDLKAAATEGEANDAEEEEELPGGGGGGFDPTAMQWKGIFYQIKRKSAKSFPIVPLFGYFGGGHDIIRRSRRMFFSRNRCSDDNIDCGDFSIAKPSWRSFTLQELTEATDNFSSENMIGKGGHAEVYKGRLGDGQVVAVKRITKEDKNDEDRIGDFLSELGIIAHINHPNAAKLIGFSADNGATETLEWKIRFKVAVGVAEGLHYLHCVCQRRIIHRDITASNILLTEDYGPQISDFGLAKWLPDKWGHHVVSPIEGTFGYMAPEYFMHGIVDEKTDVFAFGVLLLELITGRQAVDSSRQSLAMWAKPLLEQNNIKEIADPRLGDAYDVVEMERSMSVALSCIQHLPNMRPNMKKVVEVLKGENELKVEMRQNKSVETLPIEDYTSTAYREHLDRHMQLIME